MTIQNKFLRNDKFFYISTLGIIVTIPFTTIISCVIYIVEYLVSCFFSNYGKFINYIDAWLDEDFLSSIPQSSLVGSLILQGDLSVEKLKSIFIENVLESRSSLNPLMPLYPELSQYLTRFICFRIWKNDPSFQIENHIVEKSWYGNENIYQEYLNKPYEKHRSPWEMTFIRNFNCNDDTENEQTSLIVFRCHHVLADGQSVTKLLMQRLGNLPLTTRTSSPQRLPKTLLDAIRFVLDFPWNLGATCNDMRLLCSSLNHPWCDQRLSSIPRKKCVVAFSPKLSLSRVKQVAKQNGVKTSAVIMSIIAGAIRKYCKWDKEVATGYPWPKPNHPDGVTNHMYLGLIGLATDEQCPFKRVQQCNKEFVRMKENQQAKYQNVFVLLAGLQLYPLSRLFSYAYLPIAISNNAGVQEGFSVGNAKCIDFRASAGTLRGATGVMFCNMSYKHGMRIAVSANESILSKEIAASLANQIEHELNVLLKGLELQ